MTSRQVALLRGVNNIGAARRVAMADLRVLFEGLGFRDVRTLLNSGNVVLSVPNRRKGRGQVLQYDKWPDTSPPWRDLFVWSLPGQFII